MLRLNPDVDLLKYGFKRYENDKDWTDDYGIIVRDTDRKISISDYFYDEEETLDRLFQLIKEGAISKNRTI